jgi:hypothetical protein
MLPTSVTDVLSRRCSQQKWRASARLSFFCSFLAVAAYFLIPSIVANEDLPSAAAAAQPIRQGMSDYLGVGTKVSHTAAEATSDRATHDRPTHDRRQKSRQRKTANYQVFFSFLWT